jgi:hypothetical protein
VQAQEHLGGVAGALVEVVDAQPWVALEIADVMRREWKTGSLAKRSAGVRRMPDMVLASIERASLRHH